MKVFGDKKDFAIGYELSDKNLYGDGVNNTIGTLQCWVNGVDTLAYKYNEKELQFKGILYYIVDWLFRKMEFYLGYDMFPLPVEGNTAVELIEHSAVDVEDDLEQDLWYIARDRWKSNHSWFSVVSDAPLSGMYFRRVGDRIEISWSNDFWKNRGIEFLSSNGSYCMDKEKFKAVLFEFLQAVASDFSERYRDNSFAEKWKKKALFDLNIK